MTWAIPLMRQPETVAQGGMPLGQGGGMGGQAEQYGHVPGAHFLTTLPQFLATLDNLGHSGWYPVSFWEPVMSLVVRRLIGHTTAPILGD